MKDPAVKNINLKNNLPRAILGSSLIFSFLVGIITFILYLHFDCIKCITVSKFELFENSIITMISNIMGSFFLFSFSWFIVLTTCKNYLFTQEKEYLLGISLIKLFICAGFLQFFFIHLNNLKIVLSYEQIIYIYITVLLSTVLACKVFFNLLKFQKLF